MVFVAVKYSNHYLHTAWITDSTRTNPSRTAPLVVVAVQLIPRVYLRIISTGAL
jgi:hypothetical protein